MYSDFPYFASIKSYNPPKQAKNWQKRAKTGKMDPFLKELLMEERYEDSENIFEISELQSFRKI